MTPYTVCDIVGPRAAGATGVPAHDCKGVACTTSLPADLGLTLADVARLYRDLMRDKSYQLLPMGMEAAGYLRAKRKRLTTGSYRKYEAALDKLARYYPDLEPKHFEPPIGSRRVEEFMDITWGPDTCEPRTYNSNLSVIKDFFRWLVVNSDLTADPTLAIERAKARTPHRETYNSSIARGIIAAQIDLRDRIVLRLMLTYALRKGSIRSVQYRHFDHVRKRLSVSSKGGNRARDADPRPGVLARPRAADPRHRRRGRALPDARPPRQPARQHPAARHARSPITRCTTGGTAASSAPRSSRRAPARASGCTRPGTPPASGCSTPPATSKPSRSCSATSRC